jgi:hypothetical protein
MFLQEIIDRLVVKGVGTFQTNIFATSQMIIPSGEGPYLSITETGGRPGIRIHNKKKPAIVRPSALISVRGGDAIHTREMAFAAYEALNDVRNETLSGTFYQELDALQEPYEMPPDENGRARYQFNVRAMKSPS